MADAEARAALQRLIEELATLDHTIAKQFRFP